MVVRRARYSSGGSAKTLSALTRHRKEERVSAADGTAPLALGPLARYDFTSILGQLLARTPAAAGGCTVKVFGDVPTLPITKRPSNDLFKNYVYQRYQRDGHFDFLETLQVGCFVIVVALLFFAGLGLGRLANRLTAYSRMLDARPQTGGPKLPGPTAGSRSVHRPGRHKLAGPGLLRAGCTLL